MAIHANAAAVWLVFGQSPRHSGFNYDGGNRVMFETLRKAIWISAFAAFAVVIAFKDFRAIELTKPQPTVSHYKYVPWNNDPNRPVNEIHDDIKQGTVQNQGTVQQPERISYVLAPFAALLARLAQDDAATARNLLYATYVLLAVTVLLLAVTVVLVVLTAWPIETISGWFKKILRKC